MYYDIFRVQSSTVYDGSDVSGDADSDGFDLHWHSQPGGVLMIMEQLLTFIERLKNKNAPGRTERIYRLVKEAAIC